jgi:hypothetical protein
MIQSIDADLSSWGEWQAGLLERSSIGFPKRSAIGRVFPGPHCLLPLNRYNYVLRAGHKKARRSGAVVRTNPCRLDLAQLRTGSDGCTMGKRPPGRYKATGSQNKATAEE